MKRNRSSSQSPFGGGRQRARTLVLGLGNPILSDDSVGLRVAERLRERLAGRGDVEVDVDYRGGLHAVERMIGYDRVVLVDALCSGEPPGDVRELAADALPTQHSASGHDASLSTALALGRRLGYHLPRLEDIRVVGVEVADVTTFGERCTPAVEAALERAAGVVERLLAPKRRQQ